MVYPYKKNKEQPIITVDMYGLWFHVQHCFMKDNCPYWGCNQTKEGLEHAKNCTKRGCEILACQAAEAFCKGVWSSYLASYAESYSAPLQSHYAPQPVASTSALPAILPNFAQSSTSAFSRI